MAGAVALARPASERDDREPDNLAGHGATGPARPGSARERLAHPVAVFSAGERQGRLQSRCGIGSSPFVKNGAGGVGEAYARPDGGEALVAGLSALHEPLALRAIVGYMPEHDCLPKDAYAQDFVRYMGQLHGLPRRVAVQRANDTLYHVGLGEERFRPIGGFSTGMSLL